MNDLVNQLQDVVEKKAANHELKQELSSLVKMLRTGFESKPVGMEKVSKVFASNDTKKIKKFYDTFGSQINAMKLSGQFDSFVNYMSVEFGIKIGYETDICPRINYIKKGKKRTKFEDLYTGYFYEPIPKSPTEAVTKILSSLDTLTKDFNNESDGVKEALKSVIEAQTQYSPLTVKTLDKILTKSRIKAIDAEQVAMEIDANITLQSQAVDLVVGSTETEENN